MISNQWQVVLLSSGHDRAVFDCGVEEVNRYLREQAGQNARQDISRTFIAAQVDNPMTIGAYYTLTLRSVGFRELPKERRLPHYPILLVHLGRLAVSVNFQGQGMGKRMLLDALRRTILISDEGGAYAVEVVALHRQAAEFYMKYGFVPLDDNDSLHLYLPLKAIRTLSF